MKILLGHFLFLSGVEYLEKKDATEMPKAIEL